MTAYGEQLESIRRSAAALAAVEPTQHDLPVPNCPGWSVGDVIRHVAWQGPASWIAVIEGKDPLAAIAAATDQEPSVTESLGGLVAYLAAHDPAEPCRGFFAESDFAGWGVHCSVEIALHRSDVEAALGLPARLEPAEARDGLHWSAALLEPMTTFIPDGTPSGALTLSPTIGEPMQLGSGDPVVTASGDPADLVFWLWGRDRGGVEIVGDAAVAAAWAAVTGGSFQHEAIR